MCLAHVDSKYIRLGLDGIMIDMTNGGLFFYRYEWFDEITFLDQNKHDGFLVLWELGIE
jgi:hypothetical protein